MSRKIDNDNPLPRYFQVYHSLMERIRSGEFGSKPLPPERSLTTEYGVSRITIVKVMDKLKHEGVIDRQHGRGTFVRSTKLVNQSQGQLDIFAQFQSPEVEAFWQLIDCGFFPAPPKVAEWFHLRSNSLHFQSTFRHSINGQLLGYHQIGVRHDLAIDDAIDQIAEQELFDYLRALPGRHNCQVQRGFEALIAREEDVLRLEVSIGAPILMIDTLYTDPQNQIVQFVRSWLRGDVFRFNL